MIHRTITMEEAEQLTGLFMQCDVKCLIGVFDDKKLIGLYGITDNNELSLHTFEHNLTPLQFWRELKKGLCLLLQNNYVNFYAEGQHKYLQKLGFIQENGNFIYRSNLNGK